MDFRQKYIFPILFFTIILILFFNLGQWYIYSRVKGFAESVYQNNLLSQTRLAASGFDGDIIMNLAGEDFFPPDLIEVRSKLQDLKEEFAYYNVKLLDLDGNSLLVRRSPDTLSFGLEYNLGPFISASAGLASATDLITREDLYLISAYAPIYNSLDSVVAVLGIDADFDFFESLADFKDNLIYINIVSLIFVLLMGAGFVIINRRLIAAQEALYQASALTSMGQMAATMAHEIKNPLGIIKATADRIKRKYGAQSDDRIFDFISEEVDRLNIILEGYLDFARPTAAGRSLKRIDLKSLVGELLRQCRTDFANDKIEIELQADDQEMPVLDDGIGLKQAILNLILNARDVSVGGGKIRVELKSSGDEHILRIIDHGGGIKKEVKKRLFEPFVSSKARGSGLGLYVARQIIQQNGGSLSVKNNNEGGATAEVVLPAYKEN